MSHPFSMLEKQQYMSLTTFRKSGQGVATPVWFALVDQKIFVMTDNRSGKMKRIRNNPCVTVAPCNYKGDVKGPAVQAAVRILSPEQSQEARQALNRKYGLQKRIFDFLMKLQRHKDTGVFIEIIPA